MTRPEPSSSGLRLAAHIRIDAGDKIAMACQHHIKHIRFAAFLPKAQIDQKEFTIRAVSHCGGNHHNVAATITVWR